MNHYHVAQLSARDSALDDAQETIRDLKYRLADCVCGKNDMTTNQQINLYSDVYLKYLTARRDWPGLHHPEPLAKDYGLDEWTGGQVRRRVELDFKRPVA